MVYMTLGKSLNLPSMYLFEKWGSNIYHTGVLWEPNVVMNVKDLYEL